MFLKILLLCLISSVYAQHPNPVPSTADDNYYDTPPEVQRKIDKKIRKKKAKKLTRKQKQQELEHQRLKRYDPTSY